MIFPAIEEMRIPIQYLANMLTAGGYRNGKRFLETYGNDALIYESNFFWEKTFDEFQRLTRVGLTAHQTKQMYRLLAIAKYEDRFVIPTSHKEAQMNVYRSQGSAGYDEMGRRNWHARSKINTVIPLWGTNGQCDGCGPTLLSNKE